MSEKRKVWEDKLLVFNIGNGRFDLPSKIVAILSGTGKMTA